MDVVNISNAESPLLNMLVKKGRYDPFKYTMLSSVGSLSRQRVEVDSQTTAAFNKELHWKIPRYGILANAYIRTVLGFAGGATKAICDAVGCQLFSRIDLQTHNRVIATQYPEYAQLRINEAPYEQRQAFRTATIESATADEEGSGVTQVVVYTPLFMSFNERSQNFLDCRFIEDLEIVGSVKAASKLAIGDSPSISEMKLVIMMFSPTEQDYRSYQDANFSLQKPLSMLYYNVFHETPKTISSSGTSQRTDTVDQRCNNLVFATHIMIRDTDARDHAATPQPGLFEVIGGPNEGSSPDKIVIKATGKELFSCPARELMLMDGGSYGRFSGTSNNKVDADTAQYSVWYSLDRSRTANSGSVSFKNLSSPVLELTWTPDSNSNYEILVFHELWQVIDVNGADGRIETGISV